MNTTRSETKRLKRRRHVAKICGREKGRAESKDFGLETSQPSTVRRKPVGPRKIKWPRTIWDRSITGTRRNGSLTRGIQHVTTGCVHTLGKIYFFWKGCGVTQHPSTSPSRPRTRREKNDPEKFSLWKACRAPSAAHGGSVSFRWAAPWRCPEEKSGTSSTVDQSRIFN